jgi:hypothetical protein
LHFPKKLFQIKKVLCWLLYVMPEPFEGKDLDYLSIVEGTDRQYKTVVASTGSATCRNQEKYKIKNKLA